MTRSFWGGHDTNSERRRQRWMHVTKITQETVQPACSRRGVDQEESKKEVWEEEGFDVTYCNRGCLHCIDGRIWRRIYRSERRGRTGAQKPLFFCFLQRFRDQAVSGQKVFLEKPVLHTVHSGIEMSKCRMPQGRREASFLSGINCGFRYTDARNCFPV